MIQFILGMFLGMAVMGTALMIFVGVHDAATNRKETPAKVHVKLKQRIEIIDEMHKNE